MHAQLKWVIPPATASKVFLLLGVSHWISPMLRPACCIFFFSPQKRKGGKRGAEVSREQMSPFNSTAFTWLIIEEGKKEQF